MRNRILAAMLLLAGCSHAKPKAQQPLALAPAAFKEPAAPAAATGTTASLPYASILEQGVAEPLRTAVEDLLNQLAADTANADLRDELGRLLVAGERPELAILPLQDALYLRPGRLATAAMLAEAYVAAERGKEALALAQRLVRERPYQDDRWLFRAEIERRLELRSEAVRSASRCLLINPDAAAARAVLGYVYADQGRDGLAKKLLTEALADPKIDRAPLEYRLGALAIAAEEWQLALEHLGRSLAAKPGYAAARNDRGLVYARLGRWGEARAEFTAAIAADPELAEAHLNLANLLIDEGAKERAVAEMKAAHGVGVDPAAFFVAAGRLYALDASSQTGRELSLDYFNRARPLVDAGTQAAIGRAISKIRTLPPAAPRPASLQPIDGTASATQVPAPGPAAPQPRDVAPAPAPAPPPERAEEGDEFRPAVE